MNFYQRQAESRRLSRRLLVLFALAVIVVVTAVDLAVFTVMASMHPDALGFALPTVAWMKAHPGAVVMTTLLVLGVIGLASLYRTSTLSAGGGAVAQVLGGVRVSQDTTDPLERRLLNVVEEMSIAAGVPMPEVWLLEQEDGINAFAAGHTPANAAIAVTRGALTTLNRAELQGVIAHEFSHILNGDMRLNIRLMGWLFGLLVIALIARILLRLGGHGGRSRRGGGGGAGVVILAALVVLVVGYVGLFFGRMLQAAVSRSRESLADASAVQFTRDPTGLRGALVKIAAHAQGSRLGNPEVEEVAHMLFAPGMRRLFATHPPLLERLKAIDPRFDPQEIDAMRARLLAAQRAEAAATEAAPPDAAQRLQSLMQAPIGASVGLAQLAGHPDTAHMRLARDIRESLPVALSFAARHADSARALLFALALEGERAARARQLQHIGQGLGDEVSAAARELVAAVDALHPAQRMPALLTLFPALRQLTREERMRCLACLEGMLRLDGRMSLNGYVLRKLAQVHLRDDLERPSRLRELALDAVHGELQVLFSVLAAHGHADPAQARRAYEAGMHHLLPRERPGYAVPENWPALLDAALDRLDRLMPPAKEQLVEALVKTVAHDERLAIAEAELLRAVCAPLHCPLPPLVGAHTAQA